MMMVAPAVLAYWVKDLPLSFVESVNMTVTAEAILYVTSRMACVCGLVF